MVMKDKLTAGKLAEKAGINIETIRYYENRGLLPDPERSESGYRLYSDESLIQIRFIKTAQHLGFTLAEIMELQQLSVKKGEPCSDLHDIAAEKITIINKKIRELEKMKNALTEFSSSCSGSKSIEDCHFIHSLMGIEGNCPGD